MQTPVYKKARVDYSSAMEIIGGPQPGVNTGSSSAQRTRLSDYPKFANGYPPSKFDKLNSIFQKWRYSNIGKFGTAKNVSFVDGAGTATCSAIYGNHPLMNQNPSYGSGARVPMFIYSLTRAPQTTTGEAPNYNAYAAYPVIGDTQEVRFVVPGDNTGQNCSTLNGFNNSGTQSGFVQAYDHGVFANTTVATGSTAMLHNADITLQLYGQKNKATRYRVMLCQFDEENQPLQTTTVSGTPDLAVGYPRTSDAGMFWIDWAKKLTFNPAHKGVRARNTGMRVMFERYIYIDPVQNTDNDGSPQVVTYRLCPFFGRLLNYRWTNPSATAITESFLNASGFNARAAEVQCDVEPKARIYLVVTADNYVETTVAAAGTIPTASDSIPSMEFDIITTWRVSG